MIPRVSDDYAARILRTGRKLLWAKLVPAGRPVGRQVIQRLAALQALESVQSTVHVWIECAA